jgi:hypothetical protein
VYGAFEGEDSENEEDDEGEDDFLLKENEHRVEDII